MNLSKIANSANNKKIKKLDQVIFILKEGLSPNSKTYWGIQNIPYLLGSTIIFKNKKDAFIKFYADKIKKDPHNWSSHFKLGMLMAQQDNLVQALNCFKKSCLLNENSAKARYWLGKTYELLGKQTEALAQYKIASEIDPLDWRSWAKRAEILINKGMYKSANECLKNALTNNKRNGDLKALSAYLAYRLHRKNDFIDSCSEALKLGLKDPGLSIQLTKYLIQIQEYEQALNYIEIGLKIDPNNFNLLNNKGYCLSKLERYSDAIPIYMKAHSLNPMDIEIINNIGTSYLNLNDTQGALQWYDLGLKIQPNAVMLNNKGVCLEKMNKHEEATTLYRKAINLDPYNKTYERNYRLSLISAQKYEVVVSNHLKLFKQKKAINANDYEEMGYCLYQLKKYNDALRMFNAGLTLEPQNPIFLTRIGLCLEKLNRKNEALSYYQAALKINREVG